MENKILEQITQFKMKEICDFIEEVIDITRDNEVLLKDFNTETFMAEYVEDKIWLELKDEYLIAYVLDTNDMLYSGGHTYDLTVLDNNCIDSIRISNYALKQAITVNLTAVIMNEYKERFGE